MVSAHRYLAPHQQLAMKHQLAEMGLQKFILVNSAMARVKGRPNGSKINLHRVFKPKNVAQLGETRQNSNLLRRQLAGYVVYVVKVVLDIMQELVHKETSRHPKGPAITLTAVPQQ